MARLVMKFGGTSVADIERIRNVARHVKREVDAGHDVAVVVSAMAGKTNELVAWCRDASPMHDAREYDAVVASGEQVTSGLLAIVLQGMGITARSWQGWQLPLYTDGTHGAARIKGLNGEELIKRFKERKEVAVIAGFQGINKETGRISTLGRGGSDTSAVAVAAAIHADRCDIYTDVDGVYTTDPRIVPRARRLEAIAFEEMLEMASLGAKVLQVRSVELAMTQKVRLFVRSSFDAPDAPQVDNKGRPPGTLICDEEEIVENQVVTGIAFSKDEAQIALREVADKPGVAAAIFGPLAEAHIKRRYDRAERLRRRQKDRHHLHGSGGRIREGQEDDRKGQGQDRLRLDGRLWRRREGFGDRRRHAQSRRRRRDCVPRACGKGHQYPRDIHVRDQDFDPDRRGLYRTCGPDFAFGIRTRRLGALALRLRVTLS